MKAAVLIKFHGKGSLAAARTFAHEAEHARSSTIPPGTGACVHPAELHPMEIGNGCAGVLITLEGDQAKACADRYAGYVGSEDENKIPAKVHTMTWFLHGSKFPGVRIGDVSLHDCVEHAEGEHPEAQPVESTRSNPRKDGFLPYLTPPRSIIIRANKIMFVIDGDEIAYMKMPAERFEFDSHIVADSIVMWMTGETIKDIHKYVTPEGYHLNLI